MPQLLLQKYPGFGYMYRRVTIQTRESNLVADLVDTFEEEADDAASTSTSAQVMTVEQSVAFSATYRVPWFLFNAYDAGGYAPVPILECHY